MGEACLLVVMGMHAAASTIVMMVIVVFVVMGVKNMRVVNEK